MLINDISINLQVVCDSDEVPGEKQFSTWLNIVCAALNLSAVEVTIRVVDSPEIIALNQQYRGKDKVTNVLSFPFEQPQGVPFEQRYLGDVVICKAVVLAEAKQQHKAPLAHWAHLTIHGILHLLGYDHIQTAEAEKMEALEIDLLQQLGFNDPYQEDL